MAADTLFRYFYKGQIEEDELKIENPWILPKLQSSLTKTSLLGLRNFKSNLFPLH